MKGRIKQFTSWSFTRYSDYRLCPLKAKLKHLDKVAEPPNAAMQRGAAIHKIAENYIKGWSAKMPPELWLYKALFNRLRKELNFGSSALKRMTVEKTWAFTRDWQPTTWNDWTNCRLRVKVDCAVVNGPLIEIWDWKTGKYRADEAATTYTEQLELYALAGFCIYPQTQTIKAKLIYLDAKAEFFMIFDRIDFSRFQKIWEKRTQPMLNDQRFAPRPNQFCNWCHYRALNKEAGGGQCKY